MVIIVGQLKMPHDNCCYLERIQFMNKMRDPLIDILKGIGIISVVVGHSGVLLYGADCIPSVKFVYLYHLMIFFFTAGALFSPEKYSDPFVYIGRQLKGSLPLYWAYNFLFLALHNLFHSAELLDVPKFFLNDYVISSAGVFILSHAELLAGALWFVPMLLVAKVLFAVSFQMAEKCKYKALAHVIAICFFAAIGLYTNHWGMYFTYHIQTSFLGIPIIYLGYVFNHYRNYVLRFTNAFTCVLSAVLMFWFIDLDIGYIELSINSIISPYLFYPVTMLGLFFSISLAVVLQRSRTLTKLFSYLGSISFHIMALHFFAFKLFDWLCGLVFGLDSVATMGFPTAFRHYGLLYSIIGVAIPAFMVCFFRKFVSVKRKTEQKKIGIPNS